MASLTQFKKGQEIIENDLVAHLTMAVRALDEDDKKRRSVRYDRDDIDRFLEDSKAYLQFLSVRNSGITDRKEMLIPSIEGWTSYLGISRQTLFNYSKRNEEWLEAIDRIKNIILGSKIQLCATGKYPVLLLFFECGNAHSGYRNVNKPYADDSAPREKRRSKAEILKQIGLEPEPDQDPEEEGET